jgi:hypothetical protein
MRERRHLVTRSQEPPDGVGLLLLAIGATLLPALPLSAQATQQYVTAGLGGVTVNYLVVEDGSSPTNFVQVQSTGACGSGFAKATASQGNSFPLGSAAGTVQSGVADFGSGPSAIPAGDILIGGVVTPGTVADSGQTTANAIPPSTCIVGVALAGAQPGGTITLLYAGTGAYGTQGVVTSGILGGASPGPLAAMLSSVTATGDLSGFNFNASGDINSNGAGLLAVNCTGCSGNFSGSGTCTITLDGTAASPASGLTLAVPSFAISWTFAGNGYTAPPMHLAASCSGGVSCSTCSGITVASTLTPGCLHMHDGQGGDTGICAPSVAGSSVLWTLPTTAGSVGQTLQLSATGSPAATAWTSAPVVGVATISSGGASDLSQGNIQTLTLSANTTLAISNLTAGPVVTFHICQPGGGSYVWSWPASGVNGGHAGPASGQCLDQTFESPDGSTLWATGSGKVN